MKLNLFLVPNRTTLTSRKTRVKKILSTALTTLALTGAAFLFTSTNDRFLVKAPVMVSADTESEDVAIRGLSRRRGAFNKAIDIIADAAEADPRLASYYAHVVKRVKGNSSKCENGSGVRSVKSPQELNRDDALAIKANAGAIAPSPVAGNGLAALADGVARFARSCNSPELVMKPGYSDTEEASVSTAEENSDAQQRFTVGDMDFDTNPAIEHWMNYYTTTPIGRRTMRIGIGRSNSYLEMARTEFRSVGV